MQYLKNHWLKDWIQLYIHKMTLDFFPQACLKNQFLGLYSCLKHWLWKSLQYVIKEIFFFFKYIHTLSGQRYNLKHIAIKVGLFQKSYAFFVERTWTQMHLEVHYISVVAKNFSLQCQDDLSKRSICIILGMQLHDQSTLL